MQRRQVTEEPLGAVQVDQLPLRSPRMIITPRQIEDRSDEIKSLKIELAGLRDEVRACLMLEGTCTGMHYCRRFLYLTGILSISSSCSSMYDDRTDDICFTAHGPIAAYLALWVTGLCSCDRCVASWQAQCLHVPPLRAGTARSASD
jgi:hypothetical protein